KGLLSIFLLGFAGGLIALLTPCVFPMIPVTLSYFARAKQKRSAVDGKGFLYGLFIFLIYLSASVPFHVLGTVDPSIFNTISTNIWVNIFFFLVFIAFSLSLFGLFEITLPGNLATKADARGGLR